MIFDKTVEDGKCGCSSTQQRGRRLVVDSSAEIPHLEYFEVPQVPQVPN